MKTLFSQKPGGLIALLFVAFLFMAGCSSGPYIAPGSSANPEDYKKIQDKYSAVFLAYRTALDEIGAKMKEMSDDTTGELPIFKKINDENAYMAVRALEPKLNTGDEPNYLDYSLSDLTSSDSYNYDVFSEGERFMKKDPKEMINNTSLAEVEEALSKFSIEKFPYVIVFETLLRTEPEIVDASTFEGGLWIQSLVLWDARTKEAIRRSIYISQASENISYSHREGTSGLPEFKSAVLSNMASNSEKEKLKTIGELADPEPEEEEEEEEDEEEEGD